MKITISKQFHMNCAHSLPHLPEGHKCRELHGHTYGITIHCTGELEGEWLIDYADISAAWAPLFVQLDHKNLNNVLSCATTAENLAVWLSIKLKPVLPLLSRIEIQETESSNVILDL